MWQRPAPTTTSTTKKTSPTTFPPVRYKTDKNGNKVIVEEPTKKKPQKPLSDFYPSTIPAPPRPEGPYPRPTLPHDNAAKKILDGHRKKMGLK